MRNLIYILIFSFFSCNSDESGQFENFELIGKWKLTKAFISAGGPQYWVTVEDGEEFVFFKDGTFNSSRYDECTSGTFSTEPNRLFLRYNCEGFESESENTKGFVTFDLKYESDSFVATPTSGPVCIEGCSYRYDRK